MNEIGTLPAPVQWTVEQLLKVGGEIAKRLDAIRASISMSNARWIALNERGRAISDPARRDAVLAAVKAGVREQERIVGIYRMAGERFEAAWRAFRGWAAQHGAAPAALNGLGIGPAAVPAALVAGLLLIAGTAKTLETLLGAQVRRAGALEKAVAGFAAGQLTEAQFRQAAAAINGQADREKPAGDPFGIAAIAEALMPLALIALGFVVLPRLLDAMGSRRRLA